MIPVLNHAVRLDGLGQLSSVLVPLFKPCIHSYLHRNVDIKHLVHGMPIPRDARTYVSGFQSFPRSHVRASNKARDMPKESISNNHGRMG